MVVFTERRQLWAVNIFSRPVNTHAISHTHHLKLFKFVSACCICLLLFNTSTRGIFLRYADYIRQSLLKKNSCPCDSLAKQSNMSFSLFKSMLLLRLGDVERNPGPPSETGLCVVHVNVRSLGKKLDLFEAESKHCCLLYTSPSPRDL